MKYEYLNVQVKETEPLSNNSLNLCGGDGWELICANITASSDGNFRKYILYIFKRELVIDKF